MEIKNIKREDDLIKPYPLLTHDPCQPNLKNNAEKP